MLNEIKERIMNIESHIDHSKDGVLSISHQNKL